MRNFSINTPQVISEDVAGETVVINLDTGSYYNLNEDAAKIWVLLAEGVELDGLKNAIEPTEDCSKNEASTYLEAFFAKLIEQQLVKEINVALSPKAPIRIDVTNLVLDVYTDMQDLLGLDPIHEVDAAAGWPTKQ